jgi:prepilin peptidase CpaA
MWSTYLLIILLVICVITDLKERKIYNAVLFPILIVALVLQLFTGGLSGVTSALLGMIVGLAILLIPYLLGGMGAGDVKLLAVIGGIKGVEFVLFTSVYMALSGGIFALLILLFRKGLKARLTKIIYYLHGLWSGTGLNYILNDNDTLKTTYPYGVAIAAGALYQAFFPGILPI